MTFCPKCGEAFGDITKSRQHIANCKENKTDEELGYIDPNKPKEKEDAV